MSKNRHPKGNYFFHSCLEDKYSADSFLFGIILQAKNMEKFFLDSNCVVDYLITEDLKNIF